MPLALIPLLALAALVAAPVLIARREVPSARITPATIAWLLAPTLALAFVALWCALGLYEGGPAELVALDASALLAAAAALRRERVHAALAARAPRARAAATAGALLACSALGMLALEVTASNGALMLSPAHAALELGLTLLGLLVLWLLAQRRAAALVVGTGALLLVGVAAYFVAAFKNSAILPTDLLVLGTVAAVAGGYVYSLEGQVLLGISCWLLAVAACALMAPSREAGARTCRATNLAAALACALALVAAVALPAYEDGLGVSISYWRSLTTYRTYGFFPSFIAVAQDLPIEMPAGYSDEGAEELERAYAATYDETRGSTEARDAAEEQFEDLQPTIIVIVNETFADISTLGGELWGYSGPERFNAVRDALMRGALDVSVVGGGTCNSEFELLTGVSLAYVGEGKYPFSLYDLSGAPSLARQLGDLGYATTAMHPNLPTNYNRTVAYEALGFDTFLSEEDFAGDEWYHSGVSDAATYDKILELLAADDGPQLIYDLTMQNHSAYDQNNIGDVPQYDVGDLDDGGNEQVSEYLACVEKSDQALAEFMAELEQLDRPVILVFLGDHMPYCAPWINNSLFEGEGTFEHTLNVYRTDYLIWANYDVAGSEQASEDVRTGISFLSARVLEAIGAPLTDFQKAQLVASEELSSVTLMGARTVDGTWTELGSEGGLGQTFDDLAQISYLEFARNLE